MHLTESASVSASALSDAIVQALARSINGQVISPEDDAYDSARKVWNGVIDKYPALIVRPRTTKDVAVAVDFAKNNHLLLSVRGGGHNVAGHGTNDNGMVIDLSLMKKIEVDPVKRTACAEGGVTWGELDAATQVYGLATPGGVYSGPGIAGLPLGGGFGWLRSKPGLSADNLIGAEVVTANGTILHVSETKYSDVLWGLRGGGGNFGIVTKFEYKLHPVGPEVMFAFVLHDGSDPKEMKRALRFYKEYHETASDEVSTLLALGQIPPTEHYPEPIHMTPFILLAGLYAGAPAEGQRVLQPLIDFGTPLVDLSGVVPYVQAQQAFDEEYPDGLRYYWKSLNLTRFDDEAIVTIVEHARQQPSAFSTTDVWHIGGAVSKTDARATAFYGRHASFLVNPEANWVKPADDDANIGWARGFVDSLAPFSDGSRYLNFAGFQEEGEAMMRGAFGAHYERMAELKRKYDPTNLFRLNQNVKPDGTSPE